MARLSDVIEEFIKELFEESREDELQIQRNELANQFSCAPSQINYVLTTRFTTDKGYYIESRRGGGGYIVIKKCENHKDYSFCELLMEKIGESITYDSALLLLNGLKESEVLTDREFVLLKTAINDRTLCNLLGDKNIVRADILKSCILSLLL